ncbi:MAG: polI [Gammaproteobacteria bacterium]|nr:polI [Gammaproteobacteria bacterium]
MSAPRKTLLLIDGSYYLFRAYFATQGQGLTNSRGEPTGAIFGVINMLNRTTEDVQPDYIAVVFDAKGKTFRHDVYPEYKANRPPAPEDLVRQIAPIHDLIRARGVPLLVIDGVEADDVIATLALAADQQGLATVIASGDKDLAQIVSANIHLINTMDNTRLDPSGVKDKFGVPPERIVDYLALVGDSVDNVPGVPKVGPKTAAKWLAEYGSLAGVIEHAAAIPGKVGESLRASLDQLPLSAQLVTLKTDVALPVTPDRLVPEKPDLDRLAEQYRRWEFRNLLAKLQQNPNAAAPAPAAPAMTPAVAVYETILTDADLDRWLRKLATAELIALDTETTSLDYMAAELVGISFSIQPHTAAYIPLGHAYPGCPAQLDRGRVLEKLRPLLESASVRKLGHNLKYDRSVLLNHGITLNGIAHDTMLQSYILDSTATRHDMDTLAKKYLDYDTIHYEDVAGKGAKQIPFAAVTVETATRYAAEDADITLRLHQYFWPRLTQHGGLHNVYQTIEMPLLEVLSRMERNGVLIDAAVLRRQSVELTQEMLRIEQAAYATAGQSFNMSSPKQIQAILYEQMQLPVLVRTPKGQPSTEESVLQDLAQEYELPRLILDYRSLSKLKTTYTDKLPQQISKLTGRVHASFHQAVASTGRLSSSDPNLQNIPIRSGAGRKIRQAFIANPGCKILSADYSQIELRIMAHLSEDASLLAAFNQNLDIHRRTAAEIFAVSLEAVSEDQRRAAKAINFGLIYGMSPFGLAKQLGIGRAEAKEYVDRYFARYPAVRKFMEQTKLAAHDLGYVETVFNRRLYLPEINSRNSARRQYAERTAINAPMQGTAADIIKIAMIAIDKHLSGLNHDVRMIMQVHDELVFEVATEKITEIQDLIRHDMEGAAQLRVPLVVDIGIGENWDKAH